LGRKENSMEIGTIVRHQFNGEMIGEVVGFGSGAFEGKLKVKWVKSWVPVTVNGKLVLEEKHGLCDFVLPQFLLSKTPDIPRNS